MIGLFGHPEEEAAVEVALRSLEEVALGTPEDGVWTYCACGYQKSDFAKHNRARCRNVWQLIREDGRGE